MRSVTKGRLALHALFAWLVSTSVGPRAWAGAPPVEEEDVIDASRVVRRPDPDAGADRHFESLLVYPARPVTTGEETAATDGAPARLFDENGRVSTAGLGTAGARATARLFLRARRAIASFSAAPGSVLGGALALLAGFLAATAVMLPIFLFQRLRRPARAKRRAPIRHIGESRRRPRPL